MQRDIPPVIFSAIQHLPSGTSRGGHKLVTRTKTVVHGRNGVLGNGSDESFFFNIFYLWRHVPLAASVKLIAAFDSRRPFGSCL